LTTTAEANVIGASKPVITVTVIRAIDALIRAFITTFATGRARIAGRQAAGNGITELGAVTEAAVGRAVAVVYGKLATAANATVVSAGDRIVTVTVIQAVDAKIAILVADLTDAQAGIARRDTTGKRVAHFATVTEQAIADTKTIIGGKLTNAADTSVVGTSDAVVTVTINHTVDTLIGRFRAQPANGGTGVPTGQTAADRMTVFAAAAKQTVAYTS